MKSEQLTLNIKVPKVKSRKHRKIRSPLRYPGGKSRALKHIIPLVPEYKEYREPFVGGGSVYFELKQNNPEALYWINDLNHDLYSFYLHSKDNMEDLLKRVKSIKKNRNDGRQLYKELTDPNKEFNDFEKAVRFFVLNRITFSGTVDSGGYSNQAFQKRFTESSIDRLELIEDQLQNTKITNLDYEEVIHKPGKEVFIFLDPPYYSATKSKLYGKKGDLHTEFDHERFAYNMRKCQHKWLITYDNTPEIRKLFNFAHIKEWELQYGMNNYKQGKAAKGKELFISNYKF